jgi:6-pyruvoyltetrahydropterin/6-carboxytetrahydropterin synthase
MRIEACREHEIACGHRVYGHESKCAHIHGHNYLFKFFCEAEALDKVGRVIDFSVIKSTICAWLEEHWDHKFLLWRDDPLAVEMMRLDPAAVVLLPFNPTAENIAAHVLRVVAPGLLASTGVELVKVEVYETRKCSAVAAFNYQPRHFDVRP